MGRVSGGFLGCDGDVSEVGKKTLVKAKPGGLKFIPPGAPPKKKPLSERLF